MSLQERLLESLDRAELTQPELARMVGVSQQTIWKLATGQSQSSRYLHKIARKLGTTVEYLTGENDDPEPGTEGESSLSSEERDALALLRILTERDRAAVMQLMRSLAGCAETPTLHAPRQKWRGAEPEGPSS